MPSCQARAAARRIKTDEETTILAIAQAAAWIVNSSGNLEKGKVVHAFDIVPQIRPDNYDELVKRYEESKYEREQEIADKLAAGEITSKDIKTNLAPLPIKIKLPKVQTNATTKS